VDQPSWSSCGPTVPVGAGRSCCLAVQFWGTAAEPFGSRLGAADSPLMAELSFTAAVQRAAMPVWGS
jgi:hypothetical protein